jgi:hypothetical protein
VRLLVVVAPVLLFGSVARAQQPEPEPRVGARLAVALESARGHTGAGFRNGLAGLRVDLVFSPRVSLGGYFGYADLKGKDGRAHALLSYALLEYQVPLAPRLLDLRLPLRFATGYLAGNGPVVRASAGLAIALSHRVDLLTELVTPMAWVTNGQTVFSTNASLELSMRF